MKKGLIIFFCILAMTSASVPSQAQSFQSESFEPMGNGSESFWNMLTGQPSDTFSLGLSLMYQKDPVQVIEVPSQDRTQVLTHRISLDIHGHWSLSRKFSLGVTLPTIPTQGLFGSYDSGLGDVRTYAQFRFTDPDTPLALGLGAIVWIPSGSQQPFLSDNTFRAEPRFILSYRTKSQTKYIANLGYQIRPRNRFFTHVSDNVVRYQFGSSIPFKAGKIALEPLVFGSIGLERFRENPQNVQGENPLEVLMAMKWQAWRHTSLGFGIGTGLNSALGSPQLRVVSNITYSPKPDHQKRCKPSKPIVIKPTPPLKKPDPSRIRITKTEIVLTEKVHFDTDKATIKPVSYAILKEVAMALKTHTHITHILIEGHTDSRASKSYNVSLSKRRARAVRRFLLNAGISPERMSFKGLGEAYPIKTNKTAQGRAQNRRVVIKIIEVNGKPIPATDRLTSKGSP